MSYLNVLPLKTAKQYLRVDSDQTDDDVLISQLIRASLMYIEKRTNHLVYPRDKTYLGSGLATRVYDFPINSQVAPDDEVAKLDMPLYSIYEISTGESVTLNVGYKEPTDVPADLMQVALKNLEQMYYGAKTGKTESNVLSPEDQITIDINRRFLI